MIKVNGSYDEQYLSIAEDILSNGWHDDNRTGVKTYKSPHRFMRFDLGETFPILTTKFVAFKTAVKELLWIYKDQSNDVSKLKSQNVSIWDEWVLPDGTIGTSYGYVVKRFNQMDKLIHDLKNDPQSRRMLIDLWQIPFLETGSLHPCCFLTMWDVADGKLNCMLVQRSGDWGLGVPFNTSQYAVLVFMLAQIARLKPGVFTHVINNAHIYESHINAIKLQIARKNDAYPAPTLRINPAITDFYDFTCEDIELIGYKHHGKIEMEVSV